MTLDLKTKWAHLDAADLQTLTEFIEATREGKALDYILVLSGPGNSGKTTLVRDILNTVNVNKVVRVGSRTSGCLPCEFLEADLVVGDGEEGYPCEILEKVVTRGQLTCRPLMSASAGVTFTPRCNIVLTTLNPSVCDLGFQDFCKTITLKPVPK